MGNKLGGTRGQSYLGVGANNPPNTHEFINRNPNQYDNQGYSLFDFGRNTTTGEIFQLVSLQGNSTSAGALATWIAIAAATGEVQSLTGNSGGAVFPTAGNINVVGDAVGVTVVGDPADSTLTVSLVGGGQAAQKFPTDNGTALPIAGAVNIKAGTTTLHCGSSVSFSGSSNTVQLNVTDVNLNTIIGNDSGNSNITGSDNTGLGYINLALLTSGNLNTAIGENTLGFLTTGGHNTALGYNAGSGYISSESNNIVIGNTGNSGDSGVMRFGTGGTHTSAYIAGVAGVTVSNQNFVTINTSTGQLGSTSSGAGTGDSVVGCPLAGQTTTVGTFGLVSGGDTNGINTNASAMPKAGTLSLMYLNVGSNSSTTNDTVTIYQNGSPTSLSITLTALTTGLYSNLVNSITVSPGDLLLIQCSQTTTGSWKGSLTVNLSS